MVVAPKLLNTKMKSSSVVPFLLVLFLIVGCGTKGPAVNYVEGTIMFDGKPLDKASIFFYPQSEEGGLPATGITDANGKYTLTSMQGGGVGKGATTGEYTVAVTRSKDEPSRTERIPSVTPGTPDTEMTFYDSLIPEKYTSKRTSPLTFKVAPGKNRFDINLDKE